ncbi:hypothetical protein AvCA_18030 [Azotobacter vinelandii CA]|uniref:Uncharacterized protein n=2 Tax=Azotobacter vinelandii TaxID=354 RepID=C1DDP5_AZOVD|nr:hypothetical protein Avin_18030 [Azotobacter vinelandii DJ]AGK15172.1 hypothetical protein AvCA_18030 [Azotobacter vinelandii CA]AGK20172.1 hypothetical protein AvCA6_18030 [Azotobacter vinelandii CA6]
MIFQHRRKFADGILPDFCKVLIQSLCRPWPGSC